MKKQSAGILLFRFKNKSLQVLLVHPGGPYWKNKDEYSWSIPKGEFVKGEPPLLAALREFQEETGFTLNKKDQLIELTPIKQKGGKVVYAWACEKDIEATLIKSNCFNLEWPPKSGEIQQFPEVDKAEWFFISDAKKKIVRRQFGLIEDLAKSVK